MFLRALKRYKDGKEHRYWSVVENRRLQGGRVSQRTVLYLGEINDAQQAAWQKSLEVFDEESGRWRQVKLFPEERGAASADMDRIGVRLSAMELRRPRHFGDCWLACKLWEELGLHEFWSEKFAGGREEVAWEKVLELLTVNRLLAPGSEWRLHREWFDQSAMDELLGEDFAVAEKNRLYRCLDRLLAHKQELFSHLQEKWRQMFDARFDLLLYDLTSTYFEGEMADYPKAKHGYSRDGRPDCRQVVIGLVVTTAGFPLAYEIMPGNTSDKTTLREFLKKIEDQYGKMNRVWMMDRGIPTEEILEQMRTAEPTVSYLVGTPRGMLGKLEASFSRLAWERVRESVEVKWLPHSGEVYILAKSRGRQAKEQAMRRRRLKKLWGTLTQMQKNKNLKRDDLLQRLGAAKKEAGRTYGLVEMHLPKEGEGVNGKTFWFRLRRERLQAARRREGRYLLRSNLTGENPAELWQRYMQLTEIEAAFKSLKSELGIRPIFHQRGERIEAHILVAFLAYALWITLKQKVAAHAPGLSPRAVLNKLSTLQMLEVHLPTTDGRKLVMPRYTQPEKDLALLLAKLKLQLPQQPPPRIYAPRQLSKLKESVVETF
jgi:transposase